MEFFDIAKKCGISINEDYRYTCEELVAMAKEIAEWHNERCPPPMHDETREWMCSIQFNSNGVLDLKLFVSPAYEC